MRALKCWKIDFMSLVDRTMIDFAFIRQKFQGKATTCLVNSQKSVFLYKIVSHHPCRSLVLHNLSSTVYLMIIYLQALLELGQCHSNREQPRSLLPPPPGYSKPPLWIFTFHLKKKSKSVVWIHCIKPKDYWFQYLVCHWSRSQVLEKSIR